MSGAAYNYHRIPLIVETTVAFPIETCMECYITSIRSWQFLKY